MTKDLRDTMRMESNIHVVESWKEGKKESSAEKILKEIIARNVLHLAKVNEKTLQIQDAAQAPKRINPKKSTPRHNIILKIKKT